MKSLSPTLSNTLVDSICQCISKALNSECEEQIRQRRRKASISNHGKNAANVTEKPTKTSTSVIDQKALSDSFEQLFISSNDFSTEEIVSNIPEKECENDTVSIDDSITLQKEIIRIDNPVTSTQNCCTKRNHKSTEKPRVVMSKRSKTYVYVRVLCQIRIKSAVIGVRLGFTRGVWALIKTTR